LRFQPTLRQAWLVDLEESAARTQGDLCRRHAAALVLPRGWELHDERTTGPRLVEATVVEPAAPARRVRVRRRAARSEPDAEPDQLPGFAPVVVQDEAEVEPAPELEPEAEPEAEAEPETEQVADPADDDEHAAGSRAVPAQFGTNDDGDEEEVDDALNTILDARTPLLRRAFRNSKPDA
jgi:hypothetical protein